MVKKRLFPLLVLGGILALAAAVRGGTFYTGHVGGDQAFYTALAMKLETSGLGGYTLRGAAIRLDPNGRYADIVTDADPLAEPIVPAQKAGGVSFYDVPLYYTPPLYATVLALSHAAFRGDDTYRLLARGPLGPGAPFHEEEFYATLPSFVFGLATILVTAVTAWRHFGGPWPAVVAAALLAASPVDALAASRVWPDSMAAFFLVVALLCYIEAGVRSRPFFSFLGGFALGLAVLSKGTALFFVPGALGACAFAAWRRGGARDVTKTFTDTSLFMFFGTAFVVTLPWHLAMIEAYGNPFYSAAFPRGDEGAEAAWFGMIRQRSWLVYPANTFFQNPAFLLWFLPLRRLLRNKPVHEPDLQAFVFPAVLVLMLLLTWPGKEERYVLVAYPALALTAAASLDRLRRVFDRKRRGLGPALAVGVTAFSAAWSLGLAYILLYIWQSDMLPVPF